MTVEQKHKGALSEYYAISWLLSRGYEVYKNVSAHGYCDLIASTPDFSERILIDVKSATFYKRKTTGEKVVRVNEAKQSQKNLGIKILAVVYDECNKLVKCEIRPEGREARCLFCGKKEFTDMWFDCCSDSCAAEKWRLKRT